MPGSFNDVPWSRLPVRATICWRGKVANMRSSVSYFFHWFLSLCLDGVPGTAFHTPTRQYSQTQGRWMRPDPAGLAAVDPSNPQTWNRYAYVGNNPVSFVDPSGMNRQGPGADDCNSDEIKRKH